MLKNLINYGFGKIVPGIVSLFSMWLFARLFTMEEYGEYSYYVALFTMILSISFAWIRLSSFRLYNQNFRFKNIYNNHYFNFVFSIICLCMLFCSLIVLMYVLIIRENTLWIILAFLNGALWIIVEQIFSNYRVLGDSKSFRNQSILYPIYKIALIMILIYILKLGIYSLFLGMILASIIIIYRYFKYSISKFDYKVSYKSIKLNKNIFMDFLKYGVPVSLAFIFSLIISSSDRILINYYLGSSAVAQYSLPYDISMFILGNIFIILNFTFINHIYKSIDENNFSRTQELFNHYFELILLIILPLILFVIFFAPSIVYFVLGEKYYNEMSVSIVRLMAIAGGLSLIKSYFFDISFQVYKKTYLQLIPLIIGAIINIVLTVLLISDFELIGAAIATIVAYAIALLMSIVLNTKSFRIALVWKSKWCLILELAILYLIFYYVIGLESDINNILDSFVFFILILVYFLLNFKKLKSILIRKV